MIASTASLIYHQFSSDVNCIRDHLTRVDLDALEDAMTVLKDEAEPGEGVTKEEQAQLLDFEFELAQRMALFRVDFDAAMKPYLDLAAEIAERTSE